MPLPHVFRALLVFLIGLIGLACTPARAELDETYEGLLVPNNFESAIPVTLQLHERSGQLTGTITTGAPFHVTAALSSGVNKYGQCNMRIPLTPSFSLRLYGSCQSALFEGRYTIYTTQSEDKPRGTFRLMRKEVKKEVDDDGLPRRSTNAPPTGSVTDCIKANTRCLLACPQGDYNVEFLCSNRCRRKYQACKAKFSTTPVPKASSGAMLPDSGLAPAR
ncbi:MAG: hypothetical protein JSR69_19365 [Proteobacteria bacterium]|nr:hypothetical protein [Pseudomonadota bacterium]